MNEIKEAGTVSLRDVIIRGVLRASRGSFTESP
jgi:hypothetical protein